MNDTPAEAKISIASRVMFWAGWVVTVLPVFGLVTSGIMKLLKPEELVKEFERLGWTGNQALGIGILELVCTVIYVIPQTSVLGAILLTGYLGGAVATHVRIGDPYYGPVVMGVLVWLGLFLRDARLRALVPFRN